jgi:hypothetical protein
MAQIKEQREDIVAFTLRGEIERVASGREALKMICNEMRNENPSKFEELPNLTQYRDKKWFARGDEGMHAPHRFLNTTVWADLNLK